MPRQRPSQLKSPEVIDLRILTGIMTKAVFEDRGRLERVTAFSQAYERSRQKDACQLPKVKCLSLVGMTESGVLLAGYHVKQPLQSLRILVGNWAEAGVMSAILERKHGLLPWDDYGGHRRDQHFGKEPVNLPGTLLSHDGLDDDVVGRLKGLEADFYDSALTKHMMTLADSQKADFKLPRIIGSVGRTERLIALDGVLDGVRRMLRG